MNDLDIQQLKQRSEVGELYNQADDQIFQMERLLREYKRHLDQQLNEECTAVAKSKINDMLPGLEQAANTLRVYQQTE